jgi:hypothetical protein
MVLKGSKHHLRSLKKCRTSPSSKTCRRHVYHSKGIKIKGRDGSFKEPRNGSMTRSKLRKNRHGQYVSKKKSIQGLQIYQKRGSKLRERNEAIAKLLGRHGTFEPDDTSYVDFIPPGDNDMTQPHDDNPIRKSKRIPKPNPDNHWRVPTQGP